MSSPGISQIDILQNNTMITASRVENEQYWIDNMSISEGKNTNNHLINKKSNNDESQMIKSPKSYISTSRPI